MSRREDERRAKRRGWAKANLRAKLRFTVCMRPYCYKPRWQWRKLCKAHTEMCRKHMQAQRDSGKVKRQPWYKARYG